MIKSMTGFGKGESKLNGKSVTVEIKTVNHRYFDFNCHTSREYIFLEEKLKNLIQSKISRGKTDVYVSIGNNEENTVNIKVNQELALNYFSAVTKLKEICGIGAEITPELICSFPDVLISSSEIEDSQQVWEAVKGAAEEALEELTKMRTAEGSRMKEDIKSKAENIISLITEIEKINPQIVDEYYKRLSEKMQDILSCTDIDNQRILTEAAVFADKIAVDEETVRLRSHFLQLDKMLDSQEAVGRKLDFLVQEMNREANTIGSKVQSFNLSHIVVDIKAQLEKIREQIQNIE